MLNKLASYLDSASPTKMFFKCFYVFAIVYGIYLVYKEKELFEGLVLFIFSFFGLLFNVLCKIQREKETSLWSGLLLGFFWISNVIWGGADSLCYSFMLFLLMMATFYRYFYLRDEIKAFIFISKKRKKLLGKEE